MSNRTLVRRQAVFCGESRYSMASSLQNVLREKIGCAENPEGCVSDLANLTDCGNYLMDRRKNYIPSGLNVLSNSCEANLRISDPRANLKQYRNKYKGLQAHILPRNV